MEFKDSGLPQTKLVEDAFNFSKAHTLSGDKERLQMIRQQVGMIFEQQRMMLDFAKQSGQLTDSEYEEEKKNLQQQQQMQMNALPAAVQKNLLEEFALKRVAPARELQQHADNASADVLAAVMLVDCVRSPIDYENIEKKFGSTIAGLVAEVAHIDAYPSERSENLQKAGADTKRAFMARVIIDLENVNKEIAKASKNPFNKIMLPPGQEEQIYNDVLPIWGTDKKMDARFVQLFNQFGEGASSTFRVEVGAKGELELLKDVAPTKPIKLLPGPKGPKPPKPPGNGGIGGDVF
jgi:hypothetical protein